MIVELKDKRPPTITAGPLLDLSGSFEVKPEQRGNCPVVTLTLANSGLTELSLFNPFEMIQLLILDENGRPKRLPKKAPSLLSTKVPADQWRLDSPLPIINLLKNKQKIPVEDLNREVILFAAGDEYQISLEIDRFVKHSADGPSETPVAEGSYAIRCLVSLINARDKAESRILESLLLQFQFFRRP